MSDWRNKLLWADIPTPESMNEHPVDKLAKDVKNHILTYIDRNYPVERFREAFNKKAEEMQSTPVYLNHVLAYLHMGYDEFVGHIADEIYEESGDDDV